MRILALVLVALVSLHSMAAPSASFTDIELTDSSGKSFTLREAAGRIVLLNFIFTRCPGACSVQTSGLVRVQKQLQAQGVQDVQFVTVSIDPEFDTLARLQEFATQRGVNFANWRFARADEVATRALTEAFGTAMLADGIGAVHHKMAVYLLSQTAGVLQVYPGTRVDSERIVTDVLTVVGVDLGSAGPN